jgi:N-acetyl-anhydromuramyl-L-alanine amidase AmpD
MDNIGDIYQCLPEIEIGYHAGNLNVNKSSIALCIQGNYDVQKLTRKQSLALEEFIKWVTTQRPDLPNLVKSGVKLHSEVRKNGTACPGSDVARVVNLLRK